MPLELPVEQLAPSPEGIFSTDITLPEDTVVVVAVSARNAAGEGPRSNERYLVPEAGVNGGDPSPPFYGPHDFEGFTGDTSGWEDTGEDGSLAPLPGVYGVVSIGETRALFTESPLTDIHSHLLPPEVASEPWLDYEISARMRRGSEQGSLGITAYSDYPARDAYYRVGSSAGEPFEIVAHPKGAFRLACVSESTNVRPAIDTWYRLRMRLETHDRYTSIFAKVWAESSPEPPDWQIDCAHSETTRLTSGTVGVWSAGEGRKFWDDLVIESLGPREDRNPPPRPGLEPE